MRYFILLPIVLSCCCSACTSEPETTGNASSTLSSSGIDSLEAVQEEPQRKEDTPGADTLSFAVAFKQFFDALQAGDTTALNQFIDPEQGIWIIEQPGALPAFSHYRNIQDIQRHYQDRPFTSINERLQTCDLEQREEFPKFDCAWMDGGKTGYAEDGCFYTSTTDFQNSDMWKYASLAPEQEQQVQQTQQQVSKSVLHTRSYYRFHFGYSNSRWHLLFADLRIPCSA